MPPSRPAIPDAQLPEDPVQHAQTLEPPPELPPSRYPSRRLRRPSLIPALKAKVADGKWRPLTEIAELIGADDVPHAGDTLQNIQDQKNGGLGVEFKTVRGEKLARVYNAGTWVSGRELKRKFSPLVKELRGQAKDHMAHWSPAIVLRVLSDMQRILDELDE